MGTEKKKKGDSLEQVFRQTILQLIFVSHILEVTTVMVSAEGSSADLSLSQVTRFL